MHLRLLRPSHAGLLLLLTLVTQAGGSRVFATQDPPPPKRPNILVFVADDMGWRDAGAYGNAGIRTPTIDRLAEEGLRVVNAFLTIPQCSPSRISILTGKYPHATGAEDLHMPLPQGEILVPTYLQKQGYFTGHMSKTHYGPRGEAQFQWYDPAKGHDYAAFADFLDTAAGRPFFMWVGFSDPHRPYSDTTLDTPHAAADVEVPPYLADTQETRQDLARYYDEIGRMDANMGRMLRALDERKLRENTLVIFLSDNGAPFPRAKGTVYDAGIRTPLIFRWPAQIEAGQVYRNGLVSVIDLAPTILDLSGVEIPSEMHGDSLRPLLEAPNAYAGRRYVFSERNWHDCDEHIRSVRTERYKLIWVGDYTELPACTAADVGGSPSWFSLKRRQEAGMLTKAQARLFEVPRAHVELYDLKEDPWEIDNLADEAEHRGTLAKLSREVLRDWMKRTDDFPPSMRRRGDHTDRLTGARFSEEIPPLRNDVK